MALVQTKQVLTKVGNRDRSLAGWNYKAVTAHLYDTHLINGTWCDVACLAHTTFGRDTPRNRKAVRQRMRHITRQMITSRRFLVIEYAPRGNGTHGEAQRFKIYEGRTSDEQQAALEQLESMRRRREISDTTYETARLILCHPTAAPEGPTV